MMRFATVFFVIAGIQALAGCGSPGRQDAYDQVVSRNGFAMDLEALGLPDGHPPVFQGHPALPPGHPPLGSAQPLLPEGHPTLPEGHPRCPADGPMLERPVEEFWDDSIATAPPLVSI